MFLFYVELFQKRGHYSRGDIIEGGTLLKGNTVITKSSFGQSEKNGFQDYDANG